MTPEQREKIVEFAKHEYCHGSSNNVEIDDDENLKFSEGDDGTWVQAWVFVPKNEYEEEE
jgi:hypothetical protein